MNTEKLIHGRGFEGSHSKRCRHLMIGLTLLFVGLSSSVCFAGGFETKGLGSRALGMGGAAIGLADDWSAVYWNPAGLAFLKGSGVTFEFQSLWSQQRSSISLRNISAPPPDYLAGDFVKFEQSEPDRFDNKTLSAFIPTPDLGWYSNFGDYTLASGLYATSGGGVSWTDRLTDFNDAGDGIDGDINLGFFTLNIPFAAAIKLRRNLAIGINVSGVIGYNTRKVTKTYDYADPAREDLYFENSSESFGLGLSVDAGIRWAVNSHWALGGVIRSPYSVKGTGQSRFEIAEKDDPSCVGEDCEWTQFAEEGESDVITEQPLRWGVGVAYTPTPRLKVDVDLIWVGHSDFVTTSSYDVPEGTYRYLADSNPSWGFDDAFMVRSGGEYRVGHSSAFRLGFIYDPSPFRDERASLTSPRFTDSYISTAGYGYRMQSWIFDVAYQFAYSTERLATVTTPSPSGIRTPEEVAITGQGHVATLTVGYRY